MGRRKIIAIAFALPLVLGVAVGLGYAQPARTASALMKPDLRMAQLSEISLVNTGSQIQLRFSATIVNVGAGAMELAAFRPDSSADFGVSQRVFDNAGGSTLIGVAGASLVWGGDGHSHWHVRDLETYELERMDNGSKVGTGMKGGFCFFDTTAFRLSLPGAPTSAAYLPGDVCGQWNESATDLKMGISVGWGDRYGAGLRDQYIDVTDLNSGNYRLYATADAVGQFDELDNTNNTTWVDLKLTLSPGKKGKGGNRVSIIGYGPLP